MSIEGVDRAALSWRIAKKSANANCVQVARDASGTIYFRNSRKPDDAMIAYTPAEFDAFIDGIKHGEFDDLLG
ncbi:DUF397 domain-containing protein [Actinoplanes sp. NPDC051851]|uniref:DUF397 domain-containing protein n=1 Tax=Actinoplanes sp. NPDC051851 TaxID=3154753 RepID=UPI00342A3A2C